MDLPPNRFMNVIAGGAKQSDRILVILSERRRISMEIATGFALATTF